MRKISLFLLTILFISCANAQDKYFLFDNPLFFRSFQTDMIDFKVGEILESYTIRYKNIDENIIDYGDGSTLSKYIYRFKNGKLAKVESIDMDPAGDWVFHIKNLEYQEDIIIHSEGKPGNLYTTHFVIEPYEEGLLYSDSSNKEASYIYFVTNSEIKVWDYYSDFLNGDRAEVEIIITGSQIVRTYYVKRFNRLGQKAIYTDGILTEYIQYNDKYRDVYTVTEGIGTILRYDLDGNLIQESELERKLDEHGFLIYQRVRYPDKHGYEYFAEMQY